MPPYSHVTELLARVEALADELYQGIAVMVSIVDKGAADGVHVALHRMCAHGLDGNAMMVFRDAALELALAKALDELHKIAERRVDWIQHAASTGRRAP
jgi:hypothetical protein